MSSELILFEVHCVSGYPVAAVNSENFAPTCHLSKLSIDQLAVYYITRATRALPSALILLFKTHLHFLPYYQMAKKIVCVAEPIFYFSSSGPYQEQVTT